MMFGRSNNHRSADKPLGKVPRADTSDRWCCSVGPGNRSTTNRCDCFLSQVVHVPFYDSLVSTCFSQFFLVRSDTGNVIGIYIYTHYMIMYVTLYVFA